MESEEPIENKILKNNMKEDEEVSLLEEDKT